MRVSTVIILLGILGSTGFLLFEPGGLLRGSKPPSTPGLLFSDISRVTAVQCDIGESKCAFDLVDGEWVFAKPAGAPVRTGAMQRILGRLGSVRATSVLTREERESRNLSLAELGLEPPHARLRVKDGAITRTMLLGTRSAFDTSVYAQEQGSDEVMTVPASILKIFPEDPLVLRDMSIGFPAHQAMSRVEMDRSGGFFQASRDDEGRWGLSQPQTSRLDQDRVQRFLESLGNARMEQVVTDEPGDLGQYGLVENVLEVRWWLQGDVNPQLLRIGGPVPDSPGFLFGQLERFSTVFTITEGVKTLLETPVIQLRDKRLLPVSAAEIAGVRVIDEGETVTLGREATGWKVLEPIDYPADNERVDSLVQDWSTALALDFPQADLASLLGTNAPPQFRLVFTPLGSGAQVAPEDVRQLDIYRKGKQFFAHLKQEDVIAEVADSLVATLSLDPLRYCDRMINNLAETNIISMVRIDKEGSQIFNRSQANEWLVDKDACILNENLFGKVLTQACHLQAVRLVSLNPPELSAYGLDKPVLQLTLSVRQGSLIRKTLMLGKRLPSGKGRYATIRGTDLVFSLDDGVSDQLLTPFCLTLP